MKVDGQILRALRETRGVSISRVAREVRIDRSHLSRVESGERDIGEATLNKIAEFLAVPVSVFYAKEREEEPVA